jgi:hypothetical protein
MPPRRRPLRHTEREELVAYIHGIDPGGDIVHILVHKRGNNVRFSGMLGAHAVSPSNSADLDKWIREAEQVWSLDSAIGISRSWMNIPETLEKLELMKIKAAEKKKGLAVAPELAE